MQTFKIQELAAAPESLAKNNEILRNQETRSASNEETDGDSGNQIISTTLDSQIRRGVEARSPSRRTNDKLGTMEEVAG